MWNGTRTLTLTNMGVGRLALQILGSSLPAPVAQVVDCLHRKTGGHGFDPGAGTYQSRSK